MANLKDIKNRIGSVKSTQKITRAMKMVAAAKVKKAENTVKASRPFTQELNAMFKKLLDSIEGCTNIDLKIKSAIDNYPELLQVREVKTVGLVVVTSNKGLSGAYNANVIRKATKTIKEYNAQGIKTLLFVVGQKGINALKRQCDELGTSIEKTYLEVANNPTGEGSELIINEIADYYVDDRIDKIEIVTTRFKNMMSYFNENWTVLPLQPLEHLEHHAHEFDPIMEFEPNVHQILQKVVPLYLSNILYQALLEAKASELAAQMTAMSAASTNAEKILNSLTIEYNKTRQSIITQEITEVVAGANAQLG